MRACPRRDRSRDGWVSVVGVPTIGLNGSTVATYTYDADNIPKKVNDLNLAVDSKNGQLDGTSAQTVSSACTYDTYGAPATLEYTGPSGGLFHQGYTRDAGSRP
jgi:hypothetical protein